MNQSSYSYVSKWLEVLAVMITGILHLAFKSFGAKGLFISLACVSWVGYIVWRVRQDSSLWVKWGFQTKNLSAAFFWPTVIFVVGVSLMAWYGLANDRVLWQDHILLLLLLYPLWGLLQQFLVQALGVANLMTVFPKQGWKVSMPIGIVLFAIIHFPNGLLMIATGLMAGLFILCYLRERNLWPLGLYHGWLGTFFYLWVLGKDPWVSVFGK
ncbi:MAG: CPBP family glutamic-type intramembrane protease [Nitrospirales bacterium]